MTNTRRMWPLAGLAALALCGPAAAEEPTTLAPGVRVRVSVAGSGERLKGTVQSLEPGTLSVIGDDRHPVKIPRANITRLETGWGRHGNAKKGFFIGGAFGLAGGLLACATVGSRSEYGGLLDDPEFANCDTTGERVAVPLATGVVWGGLGALIGSLVKSERWVEMPIDRLRVSVGPSSRGWGMAVSVRF
jgi:hypothetical protein